jgi:hypothetical protein
MDGLDQDDPAYGEESALRGRGALPQIEDTGGPPMPLF